MSKNNLIEQIKAILPNVTAGEWEAMGKYKQYGTLKINGNGQNILFLNSADASLTALAPEMARYILERDKPAEVYKDPHGLWHHECPEGLKELDDNGVAIPYFGEDGNTKRWRLTAFGWINYCPFCGKRFSTLAEMEGME